MPGGCIAYFGKHCFTSIKKIHNHSTRSLVTNYYFYKVKSLYGFKSLSYIECKVWEEILKRIEEQKYLIVLQSGLKNLLIKNRSDKSQI